MKKLVSNAIITAFIALFIWLMASWVDILLHNDPITGDKQYMPCNAVVWMTEMAE